MITEDQTLQVHKCCGCLNWISGMRPVQLEHSPITLSYGWRLVLLIFHINHKQPGFHHPSWLHKSHKHRGAPSASGSNRRETKSPLVPFIRVKWHIPDEEQPPSEMKESRFSLLVCSQTEQVALANLKAKRPVFTACSTFLLVSECWRASDDFIHVTLFFTLWWCRDMMHSQKPNMMHWKH